MKNANKNIFKKITSQLFTVIMILVFLLPIFTAFQWVMGAESLMSADQGIDKKLKPIQKPDEPIRPFDEAIISVTFDDGWNNIYTNGMPILQKYSIATTQFILAGTLDDSNYLNKKRIIHMHELGHEIGSHSYSHANIANLNDQKDYQTELVDSKKQLELIIKSKIDGFASPYGAYNVDSLNEISKVYGYQRNTDVAVDTIDNNDINTRSNYDKKNIISYTIRQSTTMDDIERLVQYAIDHNGWLVLTYHQVEKSTGAPIEEYAITDEDLNGHLTLIKNSKIKVATIKDVVNAVQ